MTPIGATLKEARNRQALSFEEIHAKIKIHPRVLQLLEEDKFDKLPSPLFAKSFLRSYADFLSVDADDLVRAYERGDKKPVEPPQDHIFMRTADERLAAPAISKKWFAVPAAIAIAVFAAVVLFIMVKTLWEAMPKPQWPKPSARAAKADRKATPPRADSEKKVSSDWLRSPEQGNFPSIPKKAPLELRIKAVDNVWMRVTSDGRVMFQSILKRGAAETWTARESIEIWSGNSSNMVLSLNGFNLGSPGKGVVKKLQVTHRGVKIPS